MLSQIPALIISVIVIMVLLRVKVPAGFAVFGGAVSLSLLVLPILSIPAELLSALLDQNTLRFLVVIACTLTISRLMEQRGMLSKMAKALESFNPKLSIHIVPAILGFVPMPAGALVSGMAVKDIMKNIDLKPEQGTFINYWFRHIWEYSIPVYPTTIAVSAVLGVPLSAVVLTMLPVTLVSALAGIPTSYRILKNLPASGNGTSKGMGLTFIRAAWPIILLVAVILAGFEAIFVFPAVLLLLIIHQRPTWKQMSVSLQFGLDPRLLFLSYSVMLYKIVIDTSGTAAAVLPALQSVGLPMAAILFILPFCVSMITGMSIAFVGLALPLLLPNMFNSAGLDTFALMLAYFSGGIGMMLSPVHLCLIMSAEYFKASLAKVYRLLLLPSAIMIAIITTVYLIGSYLIK